MEQNPVYWSAMILHPGHRTKWIYRYLDHGRVDAILANFKRFYHEEYAGISVNGIGVQQTAFSYPFSELTGHDYYDPLPDPLNSDEVAIYLSKPVWPVPNIISWWLSNKERFPRLSTMAFDLLTILAMSVEYERVFSGAKHTVGLQRHRLNDSTIDMLQCLKHWMAQDR